MRNYVYIGVGAVGVGLVAYVAFRPRTLAPVPATVNEAGESVPPIPAEPAPSFASKAFTVVSAAVQRVSSPAPARPTTQSSGEAPRSVALHRWLSQQTPEYLGRLSDTPGMVTGQAAETLLYNQIRDIVNSYDPGRRFRYITERNGPNRLSEWERSRFRANYTVFR